MTDRSKAILFMIISTLSFSIMGATVKFLGSVPVWEKVLVRNLISLTIAMAIALRAKKPLFGSSPKGRMLLVARSSFGFFGVALIFFATTKLALADSALFMRLSPFWVTIFAAIFLKEKISKVQFPALILAFLGTVAILRPWESSDVIRFLPALAGFAASLFAASAYTLVSKLKSYEDPATIVFFFSLFSVIGAAVFLIVTKTTYIPTPMEFLGLSIIGITAASGQMFLTHAYRLAGAAEVSIFNYIGILFSAVIGFVLWKEIPGGYTLFGAAAILSAGWIVFRFGKKK